MQLKDISTFVTIFKGAALSCLNLMWAMRQVKRNFTRNDLADLTGWKQESVAQGLRRLHLHGLVIRIDRQTWQLADLDFAAGFLLDDGITNYVRVDFIDSEHGSSLNNSHDMHESHEDLNPPPCGVDKIDSGVVRDPIFDDLVVQLIRCGAAPKTAREAIDQAWTGDTSDQDIKRRILWWRCYCLTYNGVKFPGNLVAARVAASIDTPVDFEPRDIPPRFSELREELEDFERQYQKANQQK